MALTLSPVIPARRKVHSDGFSYLNLNAGGFGGLADPVLNLDHFRMSERPFPPRPIAGFAAITAVFERSEGGFVGRDHLGMHARILPGGCYGLVSGSGMIAEETPFPGTTCEGIHISVNLQSAAKRAPPRSFALEPNQVKEWKPNPALRARVYLGKLAGVESAVALPAPFSFFEFMMRPMMSASPRVLAESGGLVYVLRGKIRLTTGDDVVALESAQAIAFANPEKDQELFVETLEESHFIFLAGRACREPVVSHGAFVMNTAAEIADAIARYQSGKMGKLDPIAE